MLLPNLSLVQSAHIILASASPRRMSILNDQLPLHVRAVKSSFLEDLDKSQYASPGQYAMETAREKALDVFEKCKAPFLSEHQRPPSLVIGADTIVFADGQILEKPESTEHAREMLRSLSGSTHTVCTGVSLVYGGCTVDGSAPYEKAFAEETQVTFKTLSEAEIEAYVASGEPMDKAGGYGIQGLGGVFVTGVVGDYQNVVGFPLARFCDEVEADRLQAWVDAAPAEKLGSGRTEKVDVIYDDEECANEDECGLPSD